MTIVLLASLAPLSGCKDMPASAEAVTGKMQAELTDDSHEVGWITATALDQPGKFAVVADRTATDSPENGDTMVCKVSATASTSAYTCQTTRPSIPVQAAEKLKAQYEERGIRVGEYTMARTGEGTAFAGYFILAAPDNGPVARIPCKGTQDGLDFKLDCDSSFGDSQIEPRPADAPPQRP